MVRELFELARTKKACIIFFDEIDAIGGARFDDGIGGDNEVQRTMLELINQLDGFDPRGNIKVLMATNRPDTLDPALTRPGALLESSFQEQNYCTVYSMYSMYSTLHLYCCVTRTRTLVQVVWTGRWSSRCRTSRDACTSSRSTRAACRWRRACDTSCSRVSVPTLPAPRSGVLFLLAFTHTNTFLTIIFAVYLIG